MENLCNLPCNLAVRGPEQYFPLARSEGCLAMLGYSNHLTHAVEGIQCNEVQRRLASRGQFDLNPVHRNASLIAVRPMDRHDESSLKTELGGRIHYLECTRIALIRV